jgi:predicted nucleotidyltransferase
MQKIYTRQELAELVRPLMMKYRVAEARIFGSYARGEADENSDIDLLLIGGQFIPDGEIFGKAHGATLLVLL